MSYANGSRGSGTDTAIDEKRLLCAYADTFGSTRVSVRVAATSDGFSTNQAMTYASMLANALTLTHAMGRGAESRLSCDPHFLLWMDAAAQIPDPEQEAALQRQVQRGSRLGAKEKATLATLPDLIQRAAWGVAWVANRCRRTMSTGFAALPVTFVPLGENSWGQGHSNLLAILLDEQGTTAQLFEPNGADAELSYGLSKLLQQVPERIATDGLCDKPVTVQPCGKGVQTALGDWTFTKRGLRERGYAVCSAVCVWCYRKFLASGQPTLAAYDEELYNQLLQSPKERHRLQTEFLDFILDQQRWAHAQQSELLKAALLSHFANTNVEMVQVQLSGRSTVARPQS